MDIEQVERLAGNIVTAADLYNGTYIGYLEGVSVSLLRPMARVKILACITYPCQTAILFPGQTAERRPYEYENSYRFELDGIEIYTGEVPDYKTSIKAALSKAIEQARRTNNMAALMKLKRHNLYIAEAI